MQSTQLKSILLWISQPKNNLKVYLHFYIYKVILNSWQDNKVHGFIVKHTTLYMTQWQLDKKNGGQQLGQSALEKVEWLCP